MAKPNLLNLIEEKVNADYVHQAINAAMNGYDFTADVYSRSETDSLLNLKSNTDHTHTNHYTTQQIDEMLINKADLIHGHDDLYASKEELKALDKSDLGGILTGEDVNGIQFILRGGTSDEHTSGEGFIGAPKEVTVDTTDWTLRVHDGVTKGGHKVQKNATFALKSKYIDNSLSFLKLLSDDDSCSYTKTELNTILKTLINDLIGGSVNG